ncbi:MAG TPA: DHHA1 domain-containing protein, partial [Aggregatilineales bacterium]|nr:DHHA1 domain-containing protein [Aggregatilineales bacterium]
IITDHHDLGDRLPPADAVVTPRRLPADHPLASLPGVGVAYKLMQHLYTRLGRASELARLLDLVALGIVADVAPQTDDTRYLLQIGLDRLRHTTRPGLAALMEVANLAPLTMTAEQIGFQLGPRLNAAGRLGDARLSIELLTLSDWAQARLLAVQLDGYNVKRRLMTQSMEAEANEIIATTPSLLDYTALVLVHPRWHPGILGIVANRLAERYARPVVLLTESEPGQLRGSARSIGGYDISAAIAAQADLLTHYGGHPGAAGLGLDAAHLNRFRERLSEALAASHPAATEPTLAIDAVVSLADATPDLAARLSRLAPFGEGNPPVVLMARGLRLDRAAQAGRSQQNRKLMVSDAEGTCVAVMWWNGGTHTLPHARFDLAFSLSMSPARELQLALVDLREDAAEVAALARSPLELHDYRDRAIRPEDALTIVDGKAGATVWAEGYPRQQYPTLRRRSDLAPAETLIIYTAPPDPVALRQALEAVNPRTVYILGAEPPLTELPAFLARLKIVTQNVIDHQQGEAPVGVLCGATAGSVRLVRAGLALLVAEGAIIDSSGSDTESVHLTPGTGRVNAKTREVARLRLENAYREVGAYRRYFRSAPVDRLIED